jgi:hypothetical protein
MRATSGAPISVMSQSGEEVVTVSLPPIGPKAIEGYNAAIQVGTNYPVAHFTDSRD